jgi:hypothetical protein
MNPAERSTTGKHAGADAEVDTSAAHRVDLGHRDGQRAGIRNVAEVTIVPSRIVDVSRASPANVTQESVGPGHPSPLIAT